MGASAACPSVPDARTYKNNNNWALFLQRQGLLSTMRAQLGVDEAQAQNLDAIIPVLTAGAGCCMRMCISYTYTHTVYVCGHACVCVCALSYSTQLVLVGGAIMVGAPALYLRSNPIPTCHTQALSSECQSYPPSTPRAASESSRASPIPTPFMCCMHSIPSHQVDQTVFGLNMI